MRKFLALLLAGTIALSLASCVENIQDTETGDVTQESSSDLFNDTVSTNESSTTNETPATQGNAAGWQTKSVTLPDIAQPEFEEVNTYGNKKLKRIISPLTKSAFDPNAVTEPLKANPLFKDYIFGVENYELGKMELYTDGQRNVYTYRQTICATNHYYNTGLFFSDLKVNYEGKTSFSDGWESISVEIEIPRKSITEEVQHQIYNALLSVYGETYAEYLCYSPSTDGDDMKYTITFSDSSITLIRTISDSGLFFNVYVDSDVYDYYALHEGNYKPMCETPEYFFDIFSKDFGNLDMSDCMSVGTQILKKYYDGYTQTYPNGGYSYRVLIGENNHKVVDFEFEGKIGQNDIGLLLMQSLDIEYEVVLNADKVVDVGADILIGSGQVGEHEDQEAAYKIFYQKGIKMLESMLGEKLGLENEFFYNTVEDRKTQTTRNIDILGLNKKVSLSLKFKHVDTNAGFISIKF